MNILDQIFAAKRKTVLNEKEQIPAEKLEVLAMLRPTAPDFASALWNPARRAPRLIAEVKYKSPSKGILCPNFDHLALARTYAAHGAAAISVLTEWQFFGGNLSYLRDIAELELGIPLLRKDFIFDRYQLLQARLAGASAVLLIVAMLKKNALQTLMQQASELGLTPLVEVHTLAELDVALAAGATVIGINNRDLHSFEVRLQTTAELCRRMPAGTLVVAESGINTTQDVTFLRELGVAAMLIGEALVVAPDTGAKIDSLLAESGDVH